MFYLLPKDTVFFDLFEGLAQPRAAPLQLGEGLLACLAEFGKGALDLLATYQRNALRDRWSCHRSLFTEVLQV